MSIVSINEICELINLKAINNFIIPLIIDCCLTTNELSDVINNIV